MRKTPPSRRIRSEFRLGDGAAEYDVLFRDAFYETALYRSMESGDDQRCFIIGRTGSGKSACFRRLDEVHHGHVIRLRPEDLSLTYITELNAVRYLSSLGVDLDPLFIALWKHVLIIEIIKHRYDVDSPEKSQRIIDAIRERIWRDRGKQAALQYLEEFEGKFWCETNERVREISSKFESLVKDASSARLVAPGLGTLAASAEDAITESVAQRAELVMHYQRLVNETQLPKLGKMERILDEEILDSPQHYTYVLIDDLDKDWADDKTTNALIRCLFRAVMDLKGVENLKILVALRTNIFEALEYGRSGGQEEKVRDLSQRVFWTKNELREMLDSRVAAASRKFDLPGVSTVADMLPRRNATRGDALDYILSRTLMRPRDAIWFMNECITLATGKDRLTWNAINAAEIAYSKSRLEALRDEWKPTYPGIDRVLKQFERSSRQMEWKDLASRLDDCALLVSDPSFLGSSWMDERARPIWSASASTDQVEIYQPLIRLLFNVGFLGCVTSVDEETKSYGRQMVDDPAVFGHDNLGFADHISNLRRVTGFVVHPAFRLALDIAP